MKPEDLPYGEWKIPHKYVPINENVTIVFFNLEEVTNGNEMGCIAIVKNNTVKYKSTVFYYSWEKPVILDNQIVVFTHTKRVKSRSKARNHCLHIYDVEGLRFYEHIVGQIKAGEFRYLKDLKFDVSDHSIFLTGSEILEPKDWIKLKPF